VNRIPRTAASCLLAALGGCAQLDAIAPKPWEKDQLAKKEMTIEGDAQEQRMSLRVYTSKENASGGYGVGGGGCGCN